MSFLSSDEDPVDSFRLALFLCILFYRGALWGLADIKHFFTLSFRSGSCRFLASSFLIPRNIRSQRGESYIAGRVQKLHASAKFQTPVK